MNTGKAIFFGLALIALLITSGVSTAQNDRKEGAINVGAAVKKKVQRCWNIPVSVMESRVMNVSIRVNMNPDATVRDTAINPDGGRLKSDPHYKTVAESALRAILNPLCQPLPLPLNKYAQWETRILDFSTKGIGRTVDGDSAAPVGLSSKAQDALQCSALYLIASSLTAGNKQPAEQMMFSQFLFDRAFASIEGENKNQEITNGMISKRKSVFATQLGLKYDQDPDEVYTLEMRCNAWRKQIGIYLNANMNAAQQNVNAVQAIFRKAPNIQQSTPNNDPRWPQSKLFVDKSFTAWTKLGRITPMSAKQQIQKKLA